MLLNSKKAENLIKDKVFLITLVSTNTALRIFVTFGENRCKRNIGRTCFKNRWHKSLWNLVCVDHNSGLM